MREGGWCWRPRTTTTDDSHCPMWVPLEILQNLIMGIPPVAKLAGRCHRTGLNADRAIARVVGRVLKHISAGAREAEEYRYYI